MLTIDGSIIECTGCGYDFNLVNSIPEEWEHCPCCGESLGEKRNYVIYPGK